MYAYEKFVVLSVDADQPNAPASYMSGGDHDGDAVLLLALRRMRTLSDVITTYAHCHHASVLVTFYSLLLLIFEDR